MFTLGETIEAKILNVDIAERKISLGVKQLQPDPWDQIEEKYKVGAIQKGMVRNLTQFGAFVELEEGIDGLIHITDLSWTKNVRHPKEVLSKGDEVEVRVLDVSRNNRRIALGLKQVQEDPWDKIEAYFTSGKQVKGEVIRVLEKGVILQMEMDMEGIIPLRDIPRRDRRKATEHIEPGDALEVTVQELSVDDKKVVLISDVLALKPEGKEEAPAEKAEVEEKAAPKRKRKAAAKAEEAAVDEVAGAEAVTVGKAEVEEKAAPKRKRKAAAKVEEVAIGEVAGAEAVPVEKAEAEEKAAPKRKRKTAAAGAEEAAVGDIAKAEEKPADKAKPKKKTPATKRKKTAAAKASETAGEKAGMAEGITPAEDKVVTVEESAETASKPVKKGSRKKTATKAKKENEAKPSKGAGEKAA